jgi:hypothetical protein
MVEGPSPVQLTPPLVAYRLFRRSLRGYAHSDFGSVLLVARGMPLGDGIKDDLGRE